MQRSQNSAASGMYRYPNPLVPLPPIQLPSFSTTSGATLESNISETDGSKWLLTKAPLIRLLVVDDDKPLRKICCQIASEMGFVLLEAGSVPAKTREVLLAAAAKAKTPTLGVTGTGGAGKSSLTDELVRRFRLDQQDHLRIAIVSIDPSRRKSGGALLGDRIRMNAIEHPNIYMRSLATRDAGSEVSRALPDVIAACKVAGFDLIIVETSGIGQGDAAIAPLVDVSLYVMTPEFGAASQPFEFGYTLVRALVRPLHRRLLLRPLCVAEVMRGVDQRDMGQRLREIAGLAARA